MPVDRESIRANAKYLRQVRPIDPEEIAEYVTDQPDPRVVRQVLREEAYDLGLSERPDGSFVPAPSGPFRPTTDRVTGLPSRYDSTLADLLVDRFGPEWPEGESGNRLRETIARLKADYYQQHSVEYDRDVALSYAIYHLADYYASTQYVLADLARDGLLPSQLRVLDVGAGVGGPALGLHDFYRLDEDGAEAEPIVEYHAVEPSEAATVLSTFLAGTGRNFVTELHRQTAQAFQPTGTFDLILFSNVISELADPVSVLEGYLDVLGESGTLLLTAPADRNTSIHLRSVERSLEDRGVTVYGPTVRLWSGERPTDECWSFDRRPDIDTPTVQTRLAEEATDPDAIRNTSVKYSYSALRTDGRRRYDLSLDQAQWAKMAEMETHVSNRIDLVAAKLSRNLSAEGHPLYKVSDGSEATSHFAVLVRETELNRELADAAYGDLLTFENVLVLYNEDEAAYNLVVDEQTIVDPV